MYGSNEHGLASVSVLAVDLYLLFFDSSNGE